MFETRSGVFLIAGIAFFALAFLSNGLVPMLMYTDQKEQTVEELVNDNLLVQFKDLADRYPDAFAKHFGEPPPKPPPSLNADPVEVGEMWNARNQFFREQCAEALREGRRVYVGEGCWHCHSEFIRPVSNEDIRWGPVSTAQEYHNELQRPVMFGTRRVGPDLSREGGRRGNSWHVVHFYNPRMTTPESVMPRYPWFFDDNQPDGPGYPNRRGFAIITYVQWLGSWLDSYPDYQFPEDINDYTGKQ
jgi:cytochrome c oxidase cbb3-type subunit 2